MQSKTSNACTSEENPSGIAMLHLSKTQASKTKGEKFMQFHSLSETYLKFPKDTCQKEIKDSLS